MNYTSLEEINKKLKTTDIKGKNYVEVNERIKAFWQLCEKGKIETDIIKLDEGICVIKAKVFENKENTEPRATGTAYEKENSTFINKTSYIENCETSAIGRALGNAGIGIDTSVASAEEVQNAIIQQEQLQDRKINRKELDILNKTIAKYSLSSDRVNEILNKYGYETIEAIDLSNYAKIGNEMSK